jgi:hypothetical protein
LTLSLREADARVWLETQFERVWPFLKPAVDRTEGAQNQYTVRAAIMEKKAQLWPLQNSAIVTEIITHPTGLVSMVFWLAGGDLDELLGAVPGIEAWAKKMGCKRIEINGRRGWLRALDGFAATSTILAKDLS